MAQGLTDVVGGLTLWPHASPANAPPNGCATTTQTQTLQCFFVVNLGRLRQTQHASWHWNAITTGIFFLWFKKSGRPERETGSFGPCHRKPVMAYGLDCHMLAKITRAGVDGVLPLLSQSPLVSKPGEVGQTGAWLCPELPWCCPTARSSLRIRIRALVPPGGQDRGQTLGFHPVFHLSRPLISNGSTGYVASVLVVKSLSIICSVFLFESFP